MKISLKYLILSVSFLAIALTLFSGISAGYNVNQKLLIENTLEKNRVYAQKMATTTDNYLNSTLDLLEFSAKDIAKYMAQEDSEEILAHETARLFEQDNTFNSTVITNASGKIVAVSPETLHVLGKQATSVGGIQSLKERKPLITKPYLSLTGRLVIFISHPIFDSQNNYLGYVGGTIYLKEKSILNDLLGEHFYEDGSYVYVVDEEGRVIYHPDKKRIGEIVGDNPVIKELIRKSAGAQRIVNSNSIDMLAGYAYMPVTNWGVVSQQPTDIALLPSKDLRKQMIYRSLPLVLLSLLFIIFISNWIAHPLKRLAYYAKRTTENNPPKEITNVRSWYYESVQLENALIMSLSFFRDKVNYFIHQSSTDPLTGLVNRRTMDDYTKKWAEEDTPYSIILFDIDKFKRINDTYGHNVGDKVLRYLADEMRQVARENDVCVRYGGEEFIMLLPETTRFEAFDIAEKLREKLEKTVSPCGEIITISSGIASYPGFGRHVMELIEIADKCLYEAKNTGRNKSVLAELTDDIDR